MFCYEVELITTHKSHSHTAAQLKLAQKTDKTNYAIAETQTKKTNCCQKGILSPVNVSLEGISTNMNYKNNIFLRHSETDPRDTVLTSNAIIICWAQKPLLGQPTSHLQATRSLNSKTRSAREEIFFGFVLKIVGKEVKIMDDRDKNQITGRGGGCRGM